MDPAWVGQYLAPTRSAALSPRCTIPTKQIGYHFQAISGSVTSKPIPQAQKVATYIMGLNPLFEPTHLFKRDFFFAKVSGFLFLFWPSKKKVSGLATSS